MSNCFLVHLETMKQRDLDHWRLLKSVSTIIGDGQSIFTQYECDLTCLHLHVQMRRCAVNCMMQERVEASIEQ